MRKAVIFVLAGFLVSFTAAYAQSDEPVTFQDFVEGKEAFEENCIECHSLEWPLKKIATRQEWVDTLSKMATKGAVLSKKRNVRSWNISWQNRHSSRNVLSVMVWSDRWKKIKNSRPGWKRSGAWQPRNRSI